MTRPSDFTLNSDYLSIAQTGRHSFSFLVTGATIQPGEYVDHIYTFTVPAVAGAIDRVMVQVEGDNKYYINYYQYLSLVSNNVEVGVGYINIYRSGPNTIKILHYMSNVSAGPISYDSFTVNVKITSFKPPNVL